MKFLYFDICIFVKKFFLCLITTSTTVMMCSQLNPHQINMLIQYSLKIAVSLWIRCFDFHLHFERGDDKIMKLIRQNKRRPQISASAKSSKIN